MGLDKRRTTRAGGSDCAPSRPTRNSAGVEGKGVVYIASGVAALGVVALGGVAAASVAAAALVVGVVYMATSLTPGLVCMGGGCVGGGDVAAWRQLRLLELPGCVLL